MEKDPSIYVEHMLQCIERIQAYVEDKDQFYSSTLIQDAVVRNLQVLSESSQRLPEPIKSPHPEIPWRSISGFRNILVHDYLGLDLDAIWSVINQDLPVLEKVLQQIEAEL